MLCLRIRGIRHFMQSLLNLQFFESSRHRERCSGYKMETMEKGTKISQ